MVANDDSLSLAEANAKVQAAVQADWADDAAVLAWLDANVCGGVGAIGPRRPLYGRAATGTNSPRRPTPWRRSWRTRRNPRSSKS